MGRRLHTASRSLNNNSPIIFKSKSIDLRLLKINIRNHACGNLLQKIDNRKPI